jgi:hypothetical protein
MAKKKIIEAVEEALGAEVIEFDEVSETKQILTDFNRADLNELRDAVNELLRR